MSKVTRRALLGATAGALAALRDPFAALAAPAQCSSPYAPAAIVPTVLSVDCACKRNFQTFRTNSAYVTLIGLVTLNTVVGKLDTYSAGKLFLFPALNSKGVAASRTKTFAAYLPVGETQATPAGAVKDLGLPPDEYFCRYILKVPFNNCIGFSVGLPYQQFEARRPWLSNVSKLADGKGVGIGWASANLNGPWFAGSRFIPNTEQCNGKAWRKVIVDGLNRAAVAAC